MKVHHVGQFTGQRFCILKIKKQLLREASKAWETWFKQLDFLPLDGQLYRFLQQL